MASLSAIREALQETIESAVPAIQCYANVPEVANLPAAVVMPRSSDFNRAMGRGVDLYLFDVIVLVSRRDDDLAQYDLDELVTGAGAKSLRQAIWNNRDLDLTDTDAHVTGMSQYGAQWDIGDVDHVGAVLSVQVTTPGTA